MKTDIAIAVLVGVLWLVLGPLWLSWLWSLTMPYFGLPDIDWFHALGLMLIGGTITARVGTRR